MFAYQARTGSNGHHARVISAGADGPREKSPVRISIGLVAWNEAVSIGLTIESIFSQNLLRRHHEGVERIELAILANGCTDDTIAVADAALRKHLASCRLGYVTATVYDLPGPDRPGAWNEFVHRISSKQSDYIVMMDSDIYFDNPDSLWNLVNGLQEDPSAYASATSAIKDVAQQKRKSLLDRACLVMTDMMRTAAAPRPHLTGGCYCGRAAFWRRIELPLGMKGDDAFLSRMVTTSLLTTTPDYRRICRPPNATFVFEAYDSVWVLFKQHRRRMIGRYIEDLIYKDVGTEVGRSGADAGEILRRRNRESPEWLLELFHRKVSQVELCMIPPMRILLRLQQLTHQPLCRAIARLPVAVLGTAWDLAVAIAATWTMKRQQMAGVWFDTRNKRLLNDSSPAVSGVRS